MKENMFNYKSSSFRHIFKKTCVCSIAFKKFRLRGVKYIIIYKKYHCAERDAANVVVIRLYRP